MSGLTKAGLSRKDFTKIKDEIEGSLIKSFGKINLAAPSVFAQIVAIFTEREAQLWELVESVYNSQYPSTAEGTSLDGVCALTGITRLNSTYTTVICQLAAVNYTTIPKGSEVMLENTNNVFLLKESITITNEKCQSIMLELRLNSDGIYSINLNNHRIVYVDEEGRTLEEINLNLVSQINDAALGLKAKVDNENIVISSQDISKSFSCFTGEGISIVSCINNAMFIAKEKGSIKAPSYAVNIIQTPIQGWISASNINAGITGRDLETDIELRARRNLSLRVSGSGTVESIRARLLNIEGVTTVKLVENKQNQIDEEGRPPHSLEALILGGDDKAIAETLWQVKPAGIELYGNMEVIVLDSNDKNQLIKFSRSVKKYIYVLVEITKADNFLDSSIEVIKSAIVEQINKLGVNQNLIYQSLFASVYSVAGIINADIKIGGNNTEEAVPELATSNIDIGAAEVAVTDISKIIIRLK